MKSAVSQTQESNHASQDTGPQEDSFDGYGFSLLGTKRLPPGGQRESGKLERVVLALATKGGGSWNKMELSPFFNGEEYLLAHLRVRLTRQSKTKTPGPGAEGNCWERPDKSEQLGWLSEPESPTSSRNTVAVDKAEPKAPVQQ